MTGKRSLPKGKIKLCPCGHIAVRKMPGGFWSCQPCIEMDGIVASLHDKAERRKKAHELEYQHE